MCGIAGFIRNARTPNRDDHRNWVEAMAEKIVHRGPDAGDCWLDDKVALAHRRLSIIDLSEAGNQPMVSGSGRYIIVYNGEIYNFPELREELARLGYKFRTRTDTEVLLALYEARGPECLDVLNGMFAVAIWDRETGELFLARDRLGKKPLYYYAAGGQFAFASEIKALLPIPFVRTDIRSDAVRDFFAYQYVPDPKTIYQDIHKIPPGFWLITDGCHTRKHQYWDVSFRTPSREGPQALEEQLFDLVDDAVRSRMVSDVPLGAFLSGGVDSSAVVGLMAKHATQPVTTCAIGFGSKRFDEVDWAKKVANQFHTDHHEFTVRENLPDQLPNIARYFDEPFADPSFVPTYFVSRLARQQVTVALAGDGGDENFAGYSKYLTDQTENRIRRCFPRPMRQSLFPSLAGLAGYVPGGIARKAGSLLSSLTLEPDQAFFRTNCFFRPEIWDWLVLPGMEKELLGYDPMDLTRQHYANADTDDHLASILYTDIKTYLPGDILTKVDRMSMANSLETRAPLLDYRVVEYAASIPSSLKLHGKDKKHILKGAFRKMLPDDVLYRQKMGFSVPLAEWLRQELRKPAEKLLLSADSGLAQIFEPRRIAQLWEKHLAGDNAFTQELWTMMAFELWWKAYQE